MSCCAAFVAAPGQGKTTAAKGLLWELQKDTEAFNCLRNDMKTAVNKCCKEGLVWRYVTLNVK